MCLCFHHNPSILSVRYGWLRFLIVQQLLQTNVHGCYFKTNHKFFAFTIFLSFFKEQKICICHDLFLFLVIQFFISRIYRFMLFFLASVSTMVFYMYGLQKQNMNLKKLVAVAGITILLDVFFVCKIKFIFYFLIQAWMTVKI